MGLRWCRKQPLASPAVLHRSCQRLGATYIKVGQFVASAPSVFPAAYVSEFSGCLDQAKPVPFDVIDRILNRELKQKRSDCFAEIDPEPIATASVAQVHAARLKTGQRVVLKVQKPNVDTMLKTDLKVLTTAARVAEWYKPSVRRAGLTEVAAEMKQIFNEECDFTVEGQRLKEFDRFLSQAQVKTVVVPRVYSELTTPRVLCMERIFGRPLTGNTASDADRAKVRAGLMNALEVWGASVTHCKFFHADVHAGNLMLLDDGRVAFIDFGIVGSIDSDSWQSATRLVDSFSRQDFLNVARCLVDLGASESEVNVLKLSDELAALFGRIDALSNRSQEGAPAATASNIVLEMFSVSEQHGLRFPRKLFLLLKQYLYFDRYIRLVSPNHADVFSFGPLRRALFSHVPTE